MKRKLLKLLFSITSVLLLIPNVLSFPAAAKETETNINPLRFNIEPDQLPLIIEKGSARTEIDICAGTGEHTHNYDEDFRTLNGWMIQESPYQFIMEDTSIACIASKQACLFSIYGVSPGTTQLTVIAPDERKACMTIIVTEPKETKPTETDKHTTNPPNTVNNNTRNPGDLNNDNRINIADLVLMQKMINKDTVCSKSADMNNDGTVDVFDMILLKRKILGF